MKKIPIYIMTALLTVSCLNLEHGNPYEKSMNDLTISVTFPEVPEMDRSGINVEVCNINSGMQTIVQTDKDGIARTRTLNGMYRISAFHSSGEHQFNALEDRVKVAGKARELTLKFLENKPGKLLIKELYVGGCSKMPVDKGDYQSDKYAILHNNSDEVIYLDSLCIGTLSPYNSNSPIQPWLKKDAAGNTIYPPFLPIIQAVWKIKGNGSTFPLQPGQDAIIAFCGAIDHSAIYPESVNLNREDCFVCYNLKYFPNTTYHPVPGDRIRQDHIMDMVIKTGKAKAYTISVNSPTFVIFKAKGQTIEEFTSHSDNVIPTPGASTDKVVCIPPNWVIDGMEVFNGSSSENVKRLMPMIDAGSVTLSATHKGRALRRKINLKKTAEKGYEVLMDTNNSSKDFEETEHASLWKEGKR